MGADHEIQSLGGTELRTRTPEQMDAPKTIDWPRLTSIVGNFGIRSMQLL